MWGIIIVVAAVVIGAAAAVLIIKRQVRGDASGCCSGCPYGRAPSECGAPPDAEDTPADCDKFK